jgi:hypothetical protein
MQADMQQRRAQRGQKLAMGDGLKAVPSESEFPTEFRDGNPQGVPTGADAFFDRFFRQPVMLPA